MFYVSARFLKVGSSCARRCKNTAHSDLLCSSTTPTRTWARSPSIWTTTWITWSPLTASPSLMPVSSLQFHKPQTARRFRYKPHKYNLIAYDIYSSSGRTIFSSCLLTNEVLWNATTVCRSPSRLCHLITVIYNKQHINIIHFSSFFLDQKWNGFASWQNSVHFYPAEPFMHRT